MKKLLAFMLLLLGVMQSIYAQEPYAVLSEDNTTMTFYYDNNKGEREPGYMSEINSGEEPTDGAGYAIFDEETATLTFKYGKKPKGDNVYDTDGWGITWKSHLPTSKRLYLNLLLLMQDLFILPIGSMVQNP